MPLYLLQCGQCGKREEDYHSIREPHPPCRECGGPRESVPCAPRVRREWDPAEGTSKQLVFDPAGLPELKREVPDIELDATGAAVFRSDSHQRRVYKQIEAAAARAREEQMDEAARAAAEDDAGDAAAAGAITTRFGGSHG